MLKINNDLGTAKRYTRQLALNLQKCYERDHNIRAGGRGPRAKRYTIALLFRGWGSVKSNTLEKFDALHRKHFLKHLLFATFSLFLNTDFLTNQLKSILTQQTLHPFSIS